MTLPSRLKPSNGQQPMLSQMEVALNTNGHQKIAKLQCSITDPEIAQGGYSPSEGAATRDQRLPRTRQDMANTTDIPKEDGMELPNAGLPAFDMDLLPGENESYGGKARKAHTFGQVESFRGDVNPRGAQDEDAQGLVRKRRRIAGLPNSEMSVTSIFLWIYTVIVLLIGKRTARRLLAPALWRRLSSQESEPTPIPYRIIGPASGAVCANEVLGTEVRSCFRFSTVFRTFSTIGQAGRYQ